MVRGLEAGSLVKWTTRVEQIFLFAGRWLLVGVWLLWKSSQVKVRQNNGCFEWSELQLKLISLSSKLPGKPTVLIRIIMNPVLVQLCWCELARLVGSWLLTAVWGQNWEFLGHESGTMLRTPTGHGTNEARCGQPNRACCDWLLRSSIDYCTVRWETAIDNEWITVWIISVWPLQRTLVGWKPEGRLNYL